MKIGYQSNFFIVRLRRESSHLK